MAVTSSETALDGSNPTEVFLIIFPTFLFSTAAALIASVLGGIVTSNKFIHFLFDFTLVVVPSILTLTVLSGYVKEISYVFIYSVIVLIVIYQIRWMGVKTDRPLRSTWNTYFITNARSTINILSVIAILAVDFKIFPREFAKTTNFGYSLMDTGVGLYIYSNGIVAPETKRKKYPIWTSIKGSVILLMIGFGRLVLTRQVEYNVAEIEYGVHWNFFFTLAFIKIFTSFILNFFKVQYIHINAFMLICSHQILLQSGLQNFVIYSRREENLLSANKEGVVSLLGFISLYLFSVYFGYILNKNKNRSVFKIIFIFITMSTLSLALSLTFNYFFDISRRLANAAYCFWVLFIGIFMTGLYYVVQIIQEKQFLTKKTSYICSPFIFEACNFNGLVFFLLGNVLTGLVNLSIDTLQQSDFVGLSILICYMFINCLAVSVLFCKKLKLKL